MRLLLFMKYSKNGNITETIFIVSNGSYYICNNSLQLEQVHHMIRYPTQVTNKNLPPCIEMLTPVNVQERVWNTIGASIFKMTILLKYATETFQEVKNSKDFDFLSLWSNIGGFIGIFLCYSSLQFPEILQDIWIFTWKKSKKL